jgi:hypothetical protein
MQSLPSVIVYVMTRYPLIFRGRGLYNQGDGLSHIHGLIKRCSCNVRDATAHPPIMFTFYVWLISRGPGCVYSVDCTLIPSPVVRPIVSPVLVSVIAWVCQSIAFPSRHLSWVK